MNDGSSAVRRRVTEPFLKARFALWLADRGATRIAIAVDGAEPRAAEVKDLLCSGGYDFDHSPRTRTAYVGDYLKLATSISVSARPGLDIRATFSDGRELLAEAKGEKTVSGTSAGADWTSIAEIIGQLLLGASDADAAALLALVLPNTERVARFARRLAENRFLLRIPVYVSVVDSLGEVREIGQNLPLVTSSS